VPARLLLVATDAALYAANTGAPLAAAGVEALSHLRASTKAAGAVGRFGVGFKAVLAVTDEPAVLSRDGGVRWSLAESAAIVGAVPSLAGELDRRGGAVPVMRLPLPATPDATVTALLEEDYDTVVVLPWRDASAADAGAALVGGLDPTLPLFLPGLASVTVREPAGEWSLQVEWTGEHARLGDEDWWVRRRSGELPAELLADRPAEERERAAWDVTWAVRLVGGGPAPVLGDGVERLRLRAPQATDEPLSVRALLSASVPLDTSRRRAVEGPLTSYVLARAAEVYAAMLAEAPGTPALLDLVPIGLPAGSVDAVLREAVAERLAAAPLFASAGEPDGRLRAREAAVVDAGVASAPITAVLAPLFPQLVDAAYGTRHGVLAALGVRRLATSDVVDLLAAVDQPASWWSSLYAAVAGATDRDALGALPVPLADGRMAPGPRGLLLTGSVDVTALTAAGLPVRAVHPDAASGDAADVLRALGAVDADPGALLDEPALRSAVEASLDDDPDVEPELLAEAVLTLAAAAPERLRSGHGWPTWRCARRPGSCSRPASCCCRRGRAAGSRRWSTTRHRSAWWPATWSSGTARTRLPRSACCRRSLWCGTPTCQPIPTRRRTSSTARATGSCRWTTARCGAAAADRAGRRTRPRVGAPRCVGRRARRARLAGAARRGRRAGPAAARRRQRDRCAVVQPLVAGQPPVRAGRRRRAGAAGVAARCRLRPDRGRAVRRRRRAAAGGAGAGRAAGRGAVGGAAARG
jgi:hypothetical protein